MDGLNPDATAYGEGAVVRPIMSDPFFVRSHVPVGLSADSAEGTRGGGAIISGGGGAERSATPARLNHRFFAGLGANNNRETSRPRGECPAEKGASLKARRVSGHSIDDWSSGE